MSASRVTSQFAAAASGVKDPAPACGFDAIVTSHIETGCTRARSIFGRVAADLLSLPDASADKRRTGSVGAMRGRSHQVRVWSLMVLMSLVSAPSLAWNDFRIGFGRSIDAKDLLIARAFTNPALEEDAVFVGYLPGNRMRIIRIQNESCIERECLNLLVLGNGVDIVPVWSLPKVTLYADDEDPSLDHLVFRTKCRYFTVLLRENRQVGQKTSETRCGGN